MIVIYGIKECLNPIKLQLSNVLQQCLNSEMGLPDANERTGLYH